MTVPAWRDAWLAAALLAVDPQTLGGIVLRARPGPVRDRWLTRFRSLLPAHTPVRRLPASITEDRLLGGLDLTATLNAGRVVSERGVLASAHRGVLIVPMAERLPATSVATLGRVLDEGVVVLERDGITDRQSARLAVVALDEGIDDERVDGVLADRMAFSVDLDGVSHREATPIDDGVSAEFVAGARPLFGEVCSDETAHRTLCTVALALGISSIRAPLLALRVARAHALLAGRDAVEEEDITVAARLALAPKATQFPEPPPEEAEEHTEPESPSDPSEGSGEEQEVGRLEDRVLEAVRASLPEGLLGQLVAAAARGTAKTAGPAGALKQSRTRGRRIGTRRGDPKGGNRLNVLETLRAAAPWQRIRSAGEDRIEVRGEDFRVHRYQERTETVTIFAVDASGSSALQRLAEAKGAVEQVLADCYVRRDEVAMLIFRDENATLVLPPTKSLLRAKRTLAGVPGGGATPLAAGIELAILLAQDALRRGKSPVLVFMTDGGANVARDGSRSRSEGEADAKSAAATVRALGLPTLFVDTSPRPRPRAREIADAMAARYLHLPRGDAEQISENVQTVTAQA
ncbi:MAG: magnesium chelatase subunit D [Myxococcota bacterium]